MWLIGSLTHIASPCSFCGDYRWLQMVPDTSVVSDKDSYKPHLTLPQTTYNYLLKHPLIVY